MLEQLGREVISYHARMLQRGENAEQYERRSNTFGSRHGQLAGAVKLQLPQS